MAPGVEKGAERRLIHESFLDLVELTRIAGKASQHNLLSISETFHPVRKAISLLDDTAPVTMETAVRAVKRIIKEKTTLVRSVLEQEEIDPDYFSDSGQDTSSLGSGDAHGPKSKDCDKVALGSSEDSADGSERDEA